MILLVNFEPSKMNSIASDLPCLNRCTFSTLSCLIKDSSAEIIESFGKTTVSISDLSLTVKSAKESPLIKAKVLTLCTFLSIKDDMMLVSSFGVAAIYRSVESMFSSFMKFISTGSAL